MNKKNILIVNVLSTSLQVVFTSLVYFLLYRYILRELSAKELGVWSLVTSTTSITNLANFGITAGLVKFVADYKVNNIKEDITSLVSTAIITLFALFFFLIPIFYLINSLVLKKVVESSFLALALSLLPFSVFSFFINIIGSVFTSVIEGCQKNYIKNVVYLISLAPLYVFTILLLPTYGIMGLAYAQLAQALFIFICSFFLSIKYIGWKTTSSFKWDKNIFKKLFNFGSKFQVVSISQMLYEPTTKSLISVYGGLAITGYYEMATRLVSQIRAVIVNANQVVIPLIATAKIKDQSAIRTIFSNTVSLIIFICIPLFALLILSAKMISLLWIGSIEPTFIVSIYILSLGMFVNILATPSYFGYLGEGILNKVLVTHVCIAILNFILGLLFGYLYQGYGVILGWGVALILGSLWILFSYAKHLDLRLTSIFNKIDLYLIILAITVCTFSFLNHSFNSVGMDGQFFKSSIEIIFLVILLLPLLYLSNGFKVVQKIF